MPSFQSNVPGSARSPGGCSRDRRNAQALATREVESTTVERTATTDLTGVSDFSMDASESVLLVFPDTAPKDVILPDADDVEEGTILKIKNIHATDTFVIDVVSSGTIDAVAGGVTVNGLEAYTLVAATAPSASNREWWVLAIKV